MIATKTSLWVSGVEVARIENVELFDRWLDNEKADALRDASIMLPTHPTKQKTNPYRKENT